VSGYQYYKDLADKRNAVRLNLEQSSEESRQRLEPSPFVLPIISFTENGASILSIGCDGYPKADWRFWISAGGFALIKHCCAL